MADRRVAIEEFEDRELLWLPTQEGAKSNTVFIVAGSHYGKMAIFPPEEESDADEYLLRFIMSGNPWKPGHPFGRPGLSLKIAVEILREELLGS